MKVPELKIVEAMLILHTVWKGYACLTRACSLTMQCCSILALRYKGYIVGFKYRNYDIFASSKSVFDREMKIDPLNFATIFVLVKKIYAAC